jgi:ankyrin repeat protein
MKHNVDINQCGGQSNKTPIYSACRNGHTDIVQILLDNNCAEYIGVLLNKPPR